MEMPYLKFDDLRSGKPVGLGVLQCRDPHPVDPDRRLECCSARMDVRRGGA